MPLFIQIDGDVVTGTLLSDAAPDPATYPSGRRFVRVDERLDRPAHFSTVMIAQDRGDKFVDGTKVAVSFLPPSAPTPPPDPVLTKLDEILTKLDQKPV